MDRHGHQDRHRLELGNRPAGPAGVAPKADMPGAAGPELLSQSGENSRSEAIAQQDASQIFLEFVVERERCGKSRADTIAHAGGARNASVAAEAVELGVEIFAAEHPVLR